MVKETPTETWFANIWKSSHKSISWEPEKPVLGIQAFEVSRLMSKVASLWQCLTDRQIVKLREEITNSAGIQRLVSDDEDHLMDLALAELIENLGTAGKSVAVLGKKCVDPTYHDLESVFANPGRIDPRWHGWQYRLKKMDRRVRKMERFVSATEQLCSELEVLEELEQSLRLMRAGARIGQVKLLEFQEKVFFQRQEVRNLQDMSPWIRTFDYTVRLLVRSLFTIVERIKYIYGGDQFDRSSDFGRCNSMPGYSLNNRASSCLERSQSNLGYPRFDESKSKEKKYHNRSPSSILCGKHYQMRSRRFSSIGLTGCITGTSEDSYTSSCGSSFRSNGVSHRDMDEIDHPSTIFHRVISEKTPFFESKRLLMNAPPHTLGYSALSLHYANIIILIEKLASSPHSIGLDARDDLYDMLPSAIRRCLRAKLKMFSRTMALSECDAAEWSMAVVRTLEWLSPLAHNMVRWQSERNFERQRLAFGSNVLLVQTLHFADRVETEEAIVELLMGLNYLFVFGRETFRECSCSREYDGCLIPGENMLYSMI